MTRRIMSKSLFPSASILIVAAMAACISTPAFSAPPLTPGSNGWSNDLESDYLYNCSNNQAITGRAHHNDENADVYMKCATVLSFGVPAELSAAEVNPADPDGTWSAELTEGKDQNNNEKGHNYTCPNQQVMTGMQRWGDENGVTKYRCSQIKVNGVIKKMTPGTQHIVKESAHTFVCPTGQYMIGRAHLCSGGDGSACDENRDSILSCGYIRSIN